MVQGDIAWTFSTNTHILSSPTYSLANKKLRCLSIQIRDGSATYSLDALLPTFSINLHDELPSPIVLGTCWSVLSGIWPDPERSPTIHIIDCQGNEHDISLFGDYEDEQWSNALGIVPAAVAAEEDEEGEEEEGEGETIAPLPQSPVDSDRLLPETDPLGQYVPVILTTGSSQGGEDEDAHRQ